MGNFLPIFRACLRQKWINVRQTKTKVISGLFYTYRQIRFTSRNTSFVIFVCNYLRGLHVATATWPCTYLLYQQ